MNEVLLPGRIHVIRCCKQPVFLIKNFSCPDIKIKSTVHKIQLTNLIQYYYRNRVFWLDRKFYVGSISDKIVATSIPNQIPTYIVQ